MQKTSPASGKCNICGTKLSGKQTKFCSTKCKYRSTNIRHQNYACQQKRGLTRKLQLLTMKGGKCEKCGYCKNFSALSFHHIDPSTKKFQIDTRHCSNNTWDKLVLEVSKCQLLCLNCHAETHHPELVIPVIYSPFSPSTEAPTSLFRSTESPSPVIGELTDSDPCEDENG